MKIIEIYSRFKNPPNLQQHMLRAAKIGSFIHKHWIGHPIDNSKLMEVLLLHDVGNIVKFQIDKYPHFLGEESKRSDYWMQVQKEIIAKYGTDDHEVTRKMLTEANIDPELIKKVLAMSYTNAVAIVESNDWIVKILLYADMRIHPTGIISLRERLDEVHSRLEKYKGRQDLYDAALQLEKQIQTQIDIPISAITESAVQIDDKELLNIEV